MKKAVIFCIERIEKTLPLHYGGAVEILKSWGISSELFVKKQPDECMASINKNSKCHDIVLVVSHITMNKSNPKFTNIPSNAHHFGGVIIPKHKQFEILEKNNVSIAPWLINPESWEEVFDKLGDRIIIKPVLGHRCHNVYAVNPDNYKDFKLPKNKKMVYCKDVSRQKPPYIQARVNNLFGITVFCYSAYSNDKIIKLWQAKICSTIDKKFIHLGVRASEAIESQYPCAMTGTDIVVNEEGSYVVEVNSNSVGLAMSANLLGNRGEIIAKACLSKISEYIR